MTTAYWCVLVGALMPMLWTAIAKMGGPRKMPMSANSAPREFLETVQGHQKRANWAQHNAFEAFPAFAAAVIVSHVAGAVQPTIDLLALIWVGARLAHGVFYIADWATLRSLVWFVGLGCVVGLFLVAPTG
ncbi:MAG: MAPEG family protein [Panacagrimonas sp.]